eukprot:gene44139-53960_t
MSSDFLDEIEVLKSIYDDCVHVEVVKSSESGLSSVLYTDPAGHFLVYVDVPPDYPNSSPVIDVSCHPKLSTMKTEALKATRVICDELQGSVCMFNIIESIRENFTMPSQTSAVIDEDILDVAEIISESIASSQSIKHNLKVIHGPVTTESKRVVHHDCDDDGETAAGTRL